MKSLLALVALANVAYADDGAGPVPTAPPKREPHEARSMRAHFLGLRGNLGQSYEVGLGYIHAHEDWGRSGYFWFGYGPDVRLTLDGDGVAGVTALALGRTAIVTHGIPTGFELGIGAARGNDKTYFVTTFGMFVTGYYGDIGYEGSRTRSRSRDRARRSGRRRRHPSHSCSSRQASMTCT